MGNEAATKYLERMRQQRRPEDVGRESARLEILEENNFKPLWLDIDAPLRICYIKVECKLCGKQYSKKSRSRISWHSFYKCGNA